MSYTWTTSALFTSAQATYRIAILSDTTRADGLLVVNVSSSRAYVLLLFGRSITAFFLATPVDREIDIIVVRNSDG